MPIRCRRLLVAALTLGAAVAGAPAAHADAPQPGLNATYFDYTDLSGPLAERIDQQIDFNWHQTEPVPGTGDDFSVRWTGVITPQFSEEYTFTTHADDGVRLWIDGELVIDDWTMHSAVDRSGAIALAGRHGLRHQDRVLRRPAHRAHPPATGRARACRARSSRASALATGPRLGARAAAGRRPRARRGPGRRHARRQPGRADGAGDHPGQPAADPRRAGDRVVGGPLPPPEPPVAGETFNAAPEGGEVLVRRPADGQLIPLEQGASLPVGTHVDVREGGVDIQTAPAEGVDRPTQDAHFEGGMFKLGQQGSGKKIVTIDLMHGEFKEACGPMSRAERRAMTRKRRNGAIARAAGSSSGDRVLRRCGARARAASAPAGATPPRRCAAPRGRSPTAATRPPCACTRASSTSRTSSPARSSR